MRVRQLVMLGALLAGCDEKQPEPPKPATPPTTTTTQVRPGDDVKRGEYLATIGACLECHTPRLPPTFNALDPSRSMSGGVPFSGPWGTVHTANVSMVAATYEPALLEAPFAGSSRTSSRCPPTSMR
ncbi:MAG: hypothetical protein ACO1OB_33140 [Archangium sp.]